MTKPLKIVIPMAGYGSRLRPLTWTKPKPLIPLAGKTVLDYLIEMFRSVPNFDQAEFVFILGPSMGEQIIDHAKKHYPELHIDFPMQPEMRGQSDAFWQARNFLQGPLLIVFSDTLIDFDFSLLAERPDEAIAWVQPVPDPRRFGVAEVDDTGWVTRLIEKPESMENNLAVVGCYYFPEAADLLSAIEEQKDQDLLMKGEFYLADAINIMLQNGLKMRTEIVETWLDAGTFEAVMEMNHHLMDHGYNNTDLWADHTDSTLIPPVNIHPSARIKASTIGPYVSVGPDSIIEHSTLKETIIGMNTKIYESQLTTSLIGDNVIIVGISGRLYLGDDCRLEQ